MQTARLQCPHCSRPMAIAVSTRVASPEYSGYLAEFERRLRELPSPFTSRQALRIAAELTEVTERIGAPWALWSEFRLFVGVRRVRPGQRWVLLDHEEHTASTPAASSTSTPPPTAIGAEGVPA